MNHKGNSCRKINFQQLLNLSVSQSDGPIIFSGTTSVSNSSLVSTPSFNAASCRVVCYSFVRFNISTIQICKGLKVAMMPNQLSTKLCECIVFISFLPTDSAYAQTYNISQNFPVIEFKLAIWPE